MGYYRVWQLTHLLVRKNIKRHHTRLAAPIKVMTFLSVWCSHLHFPSVLTSFYPLQHTHTQMEKENNN